MTNEQYLYVSYFAAVAVGGGLTVATAAILAGPNRRATAGAAARRLGAILRRVFPAWLILAVLLGFMSVSYLDCTHTDYANVVADRAHLVSSTQEHLSRMAMYLAVALVVYGFVLMLFLWARARQSCKEPGWRGVSSRKDKKNGTGRSQSQ